MIHTYMPLNCTVFLLPCQLTRSAISGSQIVDSHSLAIMFVRMVNRKPTNFEANLCGSLHSIFQTSFQTYAFYKQLQTLFIDQFVGSKATCSFNIHCAICRVGTHTIKQYDGPCSVAYCTLLLLWIHQSESRIQVCLKMDFITRAQFHKPCKHNNLLSMKFLP